MIIEVYDCPSICGNAQRTYYKYDFNENWFAFRFIRYLLAFLNAWFRKGNIPFHKRLAKVSKKS